MLAQSQFTAAQGFSVLHPSRTCCAEALEGDAFVMGLCSQGTVLNNSLAK
jgi:hypothetical protein